MATRPRFASYDGELTVCRNGRRDRPCDRARSARLSTPLKALSLSKGTVSNRFGIGATVRIVTAGGPQMRTLTLARGYLSTSEPLVHFGLGENTLIERLTVEWPAARRQTFSNLAADTALHHHRTRGRPGRVTTGAARPVVRRDRPGGESRCPQITSFR